MLLISLDGLSAEQFRYLSTTFGLLNTYLKSGIKKLTSNTLSSTQGAWGEILSGKPWWETGCVGYAVPKNSLCDLEVSSESSYKLDSAMTQLPSLVVNVPLLEPKDRLWLSEGLSAISVNPKRLMSSEPFKSYQARPFSSPAYFLGKPFEGTRLCLEAEKQRLICAEALARENNWQLGIIRLTTFDQLAHLLGNDYLGKTTLAIRPEIESFISEINDVLERIIESAKPSTVAVMSSYSHVECKKRISLNQLLAQLGFCTLKDKALVQKEQVLRYESTIALSTRKVSSPLISTTNAFVEESCIAASPIQGAIYVNVKDRFKNGIVSRDSQQSHVKQVESQLKSALHEAGVTNFNIELNPEPTNSSKTPAPDLMVYADGVDFHNLYDAPVVDSFSHPISCHSTNGFVCIDNNDGDYLSRLSLHRLLEARLN
ncbi:MAG: alkaline phosphatase family protein [Candidatus Obscuribacterales bacterium]|nr:alkaline phosphatase family protein [Candidatus Obscuribacterales bacterium]